MFGLGNPLMETFTLMGNKFSQPSYVPESILIPVETERMDSGIGIGGLGKENWEAKWGF